MINSKKPETITIPMSNLSKIIREAYDEGYFRAVQGSLTGGSPEPREPLTVRQTQSAIKKLLKEVKEVMLPNQIR